MFKRQIVGRSNIPYVFLVFSGKPHCMRHLLFLASLLFTFTTAAFAQNNPGNYYTSTDGTKIYYVSAGKGFPVLLLHGFGNTSNNWLKTPTYDSLINAGFRVIVPDMRGNGRSDMPNEQGYANDAQVQDLVGLMTSLHIQKYDVVGYSRGSIVAAKLLTIDHHINKAILGGMGDAFTNPNWQRPKEIYQALMDTTKHQLPEMVNYFKSQNYNLQTLAYQQKYQPVTTPAELKTIHIPVLVLRGSNDVDNGSAFILQSMIPGARLQYVPGDHNHAYSTPDFADRVLKFLKEID